MKFIKPQVFFANREDLFQAEIPEEEQEELVIDPIYSVKDAGDNANQIRVEIDRSFKFSVMIPPQRPKGKLARC
jgi:hypothetical protein